MRRILACLIASLFMTSAAQAAPRPLMALGEREDVALAGWDESQIFAGTPTGGWGAVAPMGDARHLPVADDAYLEDGRIIANERFEDDAFQLVTYDPARRVLDGLYAGDRLSGDLVLSMQGARLRLGVHAVRLRVVNRRTGHVVSDVKVAGRGVVDRVLRPDGVDPGPPQADAANVLWRANGCVLIAAITDAPASDPGPGPCVRSEFDVTGGNLERGRIRVKCVAGPAAGRAGTLQLRRA